MLGNIRARLGSWELWGYCVAFEHAVLLLRTCICPGPARVPQRPQHFP